MSSRRSSSLSGPLAAVLILFGLVAGWQVLSLGLSHAASAAAVADASYALRPQNNLAAAKSAANALASGQRAAAQKRALAAIRRSPYSVIAVRTLGEARNLASPRSGDRLMLLAARLGWRDAPTQVWVIERALRTGELTIATERAEGLLRLEHDSRVTYGMVRILLLDTGARKRFVAALADSPFWRHDFLWAGLERLPKPQLLAMASLLEELGHTRAPPSVTESRGTIDMLVAADEPGRAYALYRRFAASRARMGPLNNGGFEDRTVDYGGGGNSTTFDWRTSDGESASADVEADPEARGNHVLYVRTDGTAAAPLIERTLVLEPGRYVLTYRQRSPQADASTRFRVGLRCRNGLHIGDTPQEGPMVPDRWLDQSLSFVVPAQCGAQILEVAAIGGRDEGEAMFDDFRLSPGPRG